MASKLEMKSDMAEVYETHKEILEEFKISYLKWLDSLKTYEAVRKGNRYVFTKLLSYLSRVQDTWNLHPKNVWKQSKILNRGCDEVMILNGRVRELRLIWKFRTK